MNFKKIRRLIIIVMILQIIVFLSSIGIYDMLTLKLKYLDIEVIFANFLSFIINYKNLNK